MQVKLYASLRQIAGTKMVEMDFHPGISIRDILTGLTQRYPALTKYVWSDTGELADYVHVFVNSENIRLLAGLDTLIKPDDHVDIFPPLVGG